jgi:indolepyruvate decarboxylase
MNVAQYLKLRLEQLGLDRMFGVAGNYTAPFLNTILADSASPIAISRNANEMCAGYAADGYARLKGVSALYVTYSVGALSLINTIAGSYTEQVPLILINGAPTNKEDSVERYAGLMYAHTTGDMVPDIEVFRGVTVAAERITNAVQACFQIDSVLTAMLTHKRPVYIEVTEDVWRAPCNAPQGSLVSGQGAIVTATETARAVQATMVLLENSAKLILWAGVELQRFGLEDAFLAMLGTINQAGGVSGKPPVHFVTSALSKSVVSETHHWFEGCVTLTQTEVQNLLGTDGCIIGLGAWTTGKDTANQNIRSANTVFAAHDGVWVGAVFYPLVSLGDYMAQLAKAFAEADTKALQLEGLRLTSPKLLLQASVHEADDLNYDSFFHTLQAWITEQHTLVVDAGFPLVGAQGVKIAAKDGFVAQAAWLAIGYATAAATGVKLAQPDRRVLVVTGDGAFHETCQAVADHHAHGQNTVVFVLANGIYGIEQEIVNPNVFRNPPVSYPDAELDHIYSYNLVPGWQYSKITDVFGGQGRKAETVDDLKAILQEINQRTDTNFVVELVIPQTAVPAAVGKGLRTSVGEDETQNPGWPPAGVY